jgi:hypothetical protein
MSYEPLHQTLISCRNVTRCFRSSIVCNSVKTIRTDNRRHKGKNYIFYLPIVFTDFFLFFFIGKFTNFNYKRSKWIEECSENYCFNSCTSFWVLVRATVTSELLLSRNVYINIGQYESHGIYFVRMISVISQRYFFFFFCSEALCDCPTSRCTMYCK